MSARKARWAMIAIAIAGCVYWAYGAMLRSPLALLLHREPRAKVGLAEIRRLTGWHLTSKTRLIHSERRSWLDETILAEVEMPERDALALLTEWKRDRSTSKDETCSMAIADPPYWWRPSGGPPADIVEVWTSSPNCEPVRSGVCIAGRSRGVARVYLLWVHG